MKNYHKLIRQGSFINSKRTNQVMRKGSSKLLKTLIIKLSLVTASIAGPGNCPFISIPCHFICPQNSVFVPHIIS